MFESLKRKISAIGYALGFGMKAGDDVLRVNDLNTGNNTSIEQQISQKSVLNDLLKGELTEEVQQLRYSMFKAEEESMNYNYVGNGQAKKTEEISQEQKIKNRKHFTQPNLTMEYSQKEIDDMMKEGKMKDAVDPPERRILSMQYKNPNVRYKLEKYADKVEVWCDDKKKLYKTKLTFVNGPKNRRMRPLINWLDKISKDTKNMEQKALNAYSERCEILSEPVELRFTTFKASNNVPNGIEHRFRKLKKANVEVKEGLTEGYIEYTWIEHTGDVLLSERFYNKTQDEKYQKKEKKEDYEATVDMGAVGIEDGRENLRKMERKGLEA